MPRLPLKYASLAYGVIQSGLTTCIASGIGSWRLSEDMADFFTNWSTSWLIAWVVMLPVVILASPLIRRTVEAMVR